MPATDPYAALTPSRDATAVRASSTSSAPLFRRRVLLVEDHVSTCRVMTRLLESFGCTVVAAGTVAEALRAVEAGEFDLLVSDLALPDGDGHDLLVRLRNRFLDAAIAVSGHGSEDDIRRSINAGFVAHLTKPLKIDQLEAVVRGVLTQ